MAEDPRSPSPPVAIRITRPYTTEDEFLEQELESLSRTSVTLLGAQPRPQGVVLRFELVLSSGHVLMRGEGRVVGFRPNMHQGLGGLTLRFTRLDTRSKALVDKASLVRERRRPSGRPDAESPVPPQTVEPARAEPPSHPAPEFEGTESPNNTAGPALVRRESPRPGEAPLEVEAARAEASAATRSERAPAAIPIQAPAGREQLLDRLRTRGKALEPAAVQRILQQRRRQA